ncbi:MAG TPA: oligoribonuclease [Isosphaeraceae bacterium]|nr:oligoribonuclease [Isosphaeraceae bacterium]
MKLYWLDIESTGLSPDKDELLELAIAEADLEYPFEIGPICNPVFKFDAGMTRRMPDPFVIDMHTKSGLWAECMRSTMTVLESEDLLLSLVPEVIDREDRPTLAGSSVHFDHAFLCAKMPRLAARFSHRHYDVSAVKLFCRSLGMPKPPKAEAHRAHADILESIEHAKKCVDWLRSNLGG